MEYNSQLILSTSQEELLADGLDDGFLAGEWFNDFSGNESETEHADQKQAQFIPLDSGIEGEEGQNSEEWSNAMDSTTGFRTSWHTPKTTHRRSHWK